MNNLSLSSLSCRESLSLSLCSVQYSKGECATWQQISNACLSLFLMLKLSLKSLSPQFL